MGCVVVLADFEYSELSEFLENNPRNVIINIVIVILKGLAQIML